jgi:hypothetical protein
VTHLLALCRNRERLARSGHLPKSADASERFFSG